MAIDTKIILKRSDFAGAQPNSTYVDFGEFAFNYKDEKLWYRAYDNAGTPVLKSYDFQRIVPIEKGGTGATTKETARASLGAAPIDSPSFIGTASLASNANLPIIGLDDSELNSLRLATVGYTRAEIGHRAPTKTGVGASGTWAIDISKNAATATKLAAAKTISNSTASDIAFSYSFDGNSDVSTAFTINTARRSDIQTALLLRPGTDVQSYNANLAAIVTLSTAASTGLLKKTGQTTWVFDTTAYTPQSRKLKIDTGNGIEGGVEQTLEADRTWTLGLTDSGVLSGTYNGSSTAIHPFTVDVKGRITAVGNPVTITPDWGSITNTPTTLSGYGITDALDESNDDQTKGGSITAKSFIKTSGTSSEFLKADGTSDGTAYTPTARTLTITNGTGITGGAAKALTADQSWTLGLTGQALALHNLTTDGFFVRQTVSGTTTIQARSIEVDTGLSIANATGTSANPKISLTTGNLTSLRDISTAGFLTRTAAGTFTPRSIAIATGSDGFLSVTNADGVLDNPTLSTNATSANTVSTIVARDASGNFAAGAITGTSFIVSGANTITLSGTASGGNKILTLPNKTGTIATTSDIPDHTGPVGGTTITATNGLVLSAITVNDKGHTTSVSSKSLSANDIPDLDASKITSGVFATGLIPPASVTGTALTGFVAGSTVVGLTATDTILGAFQKLVPNIDAKSDKASPTFTGTVTLPTGTTTAAPLKFVSGTNLTTPVSGAVEFNGTNLFITNSSSARKTIAYTDSKVSSAGTADSAAKLTTPRTISNPAAPNNNSDINFSYSFDGSANVATNFTINTARASNIRSALDLEIGVDVQAYDADLSAIAALNDANGDGSTDVGFLRKTGTNTWAIDTAVVPFNPSEIYTLTGDVTGTSNPAGADPRSIPTTLTNSGVTAGTYNAGSGSPTPTIAAITPFTVDAKGRVTGTGTAVTIAPAWGSITGKPTTLSGYGITDALDTSSTAQTKSGSLTASSFIKTSGTSSQFLKADGSSDGTAYTPTARTLGISPVTNSGITVTPGAGTNTTQDLTANRSWTISLTAGNLTQLRDINTSGIVVYNSAVNGGMTTRSLAVGSGLSIDEATGATKNPTISLETGNLTQLRDLGTTGLIMHNSATGGGIVTRSIAVSGTGLDITNADGKDGNPTIALSSSTSAANNSIVQRDGNANIFANSFRARGGGPGSSGASNNGYSFSGGSGDSDSGMFSSADGQLEFYTNNTERVRIDSSGNVGIGTGSTTLGARLHISGGASNDTTPELRISGSLGNIDFYNSLAAGSYNSIVTTGDKAIIFSDGTVGTGNLVIAPWSNSAGGLRINSTGNVGVGMTPVAKLDVDGEIRSKNTITITGVGTTDSKIEIGNSRANDGNAYIDLISDTTNTDYGSRFIRTPGANANTSIRHRGTGTLELVAEGAAAVDIKTNNLSRMRIDSAGRTLFGATTSTSVAGTEAGIQLQHTATNNGASLSITRYLNDASAGSITLAKSRNATAGTPGVIVQKDDYIGVINFAADDGTDLNTSAASISVEIDGTPGANDMPGRIIFNTTSDGGSGPTERMRIDSAGNVGIGKTAAAGVKLDVSGDIAAANLTLSGNLTVNGTTTTLNSNSLTIDDKNLELGSVAAINGVTGTVTIVSTNVGTVSNIPSTSGMIPGQTLTKTGTSTGAFGGTTTITSVDSATQITFASASTNTAGAITFNVGGATNATADGGGITLKGATDKTFNWVSSTGAWTSSEDLNLASGKVYEINGTTVLSSTGLGSGVTSSSLTSVGTITSGTWSGSFGAVSGANLTSLTAGNLSGTIPSAVLGNSSLNIGTTSVALNRTSANLALTGISSVTLPGSTSGSVQLIPTAAAGTGTVLTLPATTGTIVTTGDTGSVTSTMISNGTIVNDDINASAAIDVSKLAANTISGITLGNNLKTLTLTASGGLTLGTTTTYNGSADSTISISSNATSANTANAIVARDAFNNFSAGTITATLSGNASSATKVSTVVPVDSTGVLVESTMGANDLFRIMTGGGNNAGYAEIATADDGTEPIYVRQYTGHFNAITRTATLLDGSGNTSFPGTVTATAFSGNASSATSATTATQFNGVVQPTYTSSLRSNVNISGGGTLTVRGSYYDNTVYVKWSNRFIVISNGRGSNFSTNGYFDIAMPPNNTAITYDGGAYSITTYGNPPISYDSTWTSAATPVTRLSSSDGILLPPWCALYYILPIGSNNTSNNANFRVVNYTADIDIPHNWVLICARNSDYNVNVVKFTTGHSLKVQTYPVSIDTSTYTSLRMPYADAAGSADSVNDGSITAAKLSGTQTGSAPVYGVRAFGRFAADTGANITLSGNAVRLANSTIVSIQFSQDPKIYEGDVVYLNFSATIADNNYIVLSKNNNLITIDCGVSSTSNTNVTVSFTRVNTTYCKNVNSIVKYGTGKWIVNFTVPMLNSYYTVNANAYKDSDGAAATDVVICAGRPLNNNAVFLNTAQHYSSTTPQAIEADLIFFSVIA